jgi:hypothetical protein
MGGDIISYSVPKVRHRYHRNVQRAQSHSSSTAFQVALTRWNTFWLRQEYPLLQDKLKCTFADRKDRRRTNFLEYELMDRPALPSKVCSLQPIAQTVGHLTADKN